jgi:integration host factor subunit alpha
MAQSDGGGGKTMTKADIIERVYEKVGFSKKESSELVEIVFETMKRTLERGEKVKISGFGKFEVRYKRPRRGRNPQTNDEIVIEERNVLSFKPSQVLKNALAGTSEDDAQADDGADGETTGGDGGF